SSPISSSSQFIILPGPAIRLGHQESNLPLRELPPAARPRSPAMVLTGCRKGLLTGTISNRQQTIRSCVSPTTRPDTYSIVGRTTTVAWPWRLVVLSRLISTCQQTKNRGLANLLSSLTVFPLLRLPLGSNDRIE